MRRPVTIAAATTLVVGSLATAACTPSPRASQTPQNTVTHSQDPTTPPAVQPLDCHGTTGWHGCGAGWFWRAGWNGTGCYPS
jgi:hypothetical protein